ncbi:MAG TPA: WYL domain-containing protein [Candidatus Limnocylindrales bacterium]
MQASRLVRILLLLQLRGQLTAAQIAGELETSPRTVYRDMEALAEAGVPVYAERGAAGGYRLVDGYRTRLTGLDADEAEALFLSGLEGPAAQLGLGTVLAASQLKVLAALPPELRRRATRLRERFLLVAPGWFRSSDELACLPTVAAAVWEGRRLAMDYRGPAGTVVRRVDPLGLVLKGGTWYLVAARDGTLRTYRISRIERAALLDEGVERPPDFDLARHWEASEAAFEAGLRTTPVTVRVRADAIGDLVYAVGGDRLGGPMRPEADAADAAWRRVTFLTDALETAHDDLLRLGDRVEVVGPPELRAAMAATAAALALRYGCPAP